MRRYSKREVDRALERMEQAHGVDLDGPTVLLKDADTGEVTDADGNPADPDGDPDLLIVERVIETGYSEADR